MRVMRWCGARALRFLCLLAYGFAWCVGLTCDNDESEVSIPIHLLG